MRIGNITFDCADPAIVADFWAATLRYEPPTGDRETDNSWAMAAPTEGANGLPIFFQRVPEGKVAKNRVHLDLQVPVTEFEAELARLALQRMRRDD